MIVQINSYQILYDNISDRNGFLISKKISK